MSSDEIDARDVPHLQKHLHTFVKCNPTILGYETARHSLDSMGAMTTSSYDDHHSREDLQWASAGCPCSSGCRRWPTRLGVEFGLKLSNTFSVSTRRGELLGGEILHVRAEPLPARRSRCATAFRQFGGQNAHLLRRRRGASTATSCSPRASGPSPSRRRSSSPAAAIACCRWSKGGACPTRAFSGTTQASGDLSTASHTDARHVSPSSLPSRKSEKSVRGSTASPRRVRAAAPSLGHPRYPWSLSVWPSAEAHHQKTPPLHHRHVALTAARRSAAATLMTTLSASATRSFPRCRTRLRRRFSWPPSSAARAR